MTPEIRIGDISHNHDQGSPARWVPTLYFAEGLPFYAVSLMALVFYQRAGVSNELIALSISLLGLPWSLTPADTSSYIRPALGSAVRRHHRRVDEFLISMDPQAAETAHMSKLLSDHRVIVVGTIDAVAHRGRARLIKALLRQGKRVVAVALRMPYDLVAYPEAPTYVCTYSILPPAMEVLAGALFGHLPFVGRLPVTIPRTL